MAKKFNSFESQVATGPFWQFSKHKLPKGFQINLSLSSPLGVKHATLTSHTCSYQEKLLKQHMRFQYNEVLGNSLPQSHF